MSPKCGPLRRRFAGALRDRSQKNRKAAPGNGLRAAFGR
ncbi:hypothetical protein [Azospirillum palustre]